jgi:hypothetical protein
MPSGNFAATFAFYPYLLLSSCQNPVAVWTQATSPAKQELWGFRNLDSRILISILSTQSDRLYNKGEKRIQSFPIRTLLIPFWKR